MPSQDTREFCGWVWSVSILKDCFLECVNIDCAIFPGVASDHSLDSFNADLSSAVAVWECYGAEAMVDSPILQKFCCGISYEDWATI